MLTAMEGPTEPPKERIETTRPVARPISEGSTQSCVTENRTLIGLAKPNPAKTAQNTATLPLPGVTVAMPIVAMRKRENPATSCSFRIRYLYASLTKYFSFQSLAISVTVLQRTASRRTTLCDKIDSQVYELLGFKAICTYKPALRTRRRKTGEPAS